MAMGSMALTLAYSCTQETILELAVRAYVRPLARCLGTPVEEGQPPSPQASGRVKLVPREVQQVELHGGR